MLWIRAEIPKDRQGGGNRPAAPLPSQPKPIRPATRKGKEAFGQTPLDISEDVFIPRDDRDIAEDPEIRRNNFRTGRGTDLQEKRAETFSPPRGDFEKRTPRAPRMNDLAMQVNTGDVLKKILQTQVTLEAGELIGVSPGISSLLHEAIKLKPAYPKPPNLVAHSVATKTRGILIRLIMNCNGRNIQGILDTGSMLNICSDKVWKTIIQFPMDTSNPVNMNDANGGEGVLKGLIQKVPLNMGNITTLANIYVGDHVPFDLLLGRPWQRGNYISIDERPEGTYLIFKDPEVQEPKYELLVTPDGMDPSWAFEPAAWLSALDAGELKDNLQSRNWLEDEDSEGTLDLYGEGPTVYTSVIKDPAVDSIRKKLEGISLSAPVTGIIQALGKKKKSKKKKSKKPKTSMPALVEVSQEDAQNNAKEKERDAALFGPSPISPGDTGPFSYLNPSLPPPAAGPRPTNLRINTRGLPLMNAVPSCECSEELVATDVDSNQAPEGLLPPENTPDTNSPQAERKPDKGIYRLTTKLKEELLAQSFQPKKELIMEDLVAQDIEKAWRELEELGEWALWKQGKEKFRWENTVAYYTKPGAPTVRLAIRERTGHSSSPTDSEKIRRSKVKSNGPLFF